MFNKLKFCLSRVLSHESGKKYKEIRGEIYELENVVQTIKSVKPIRREFLKKGYRVYTEQKSMGNIEIWVSKKDPT